MADIFVSYTKSDREWAFWIAAELMQRQHRWLAEHGKLVLSDNKGSSYGVAVLGNTVHDKLICTGNDPGVTALYGTRNLITRAANAVSPPLTNR